jgi:hypothetical protein
VADNVLKLTVAWRKKKERRLFAAASINYWEEIKQVVFIST